MSPPPCTYLGCQSPAEYLVRPAYGRDWYGCGKHYRAMSDALSVGQAQSDGAKVYTIPGGKPA
jgi:hypothetical protein